MMPESFFPRRTAANPRIYAYEDTNPQFDGLLKVGYTTQNAEDRVAQQYPTKRPGPLPYRIVLDMLAMRPDGSVFTDRDVHRFLRRNGIPNPDGEWFKCNGNDVKSAILSIYDYGASLGGRSMDFPMRPEQKAAVEKTIDYFESLRETETSKVPHFLWNAKMRFGKTFATYQLAKKMNWTKVLVLTFKPAVQNAWETDLKAHVDFEGWQFVARGGLRFEDIDRSRPLICFGSFQDYLGKNKAGGIKPKNEWVHATNWDCVVLDEYHYGAWRENAKELFEAEGAEEEESAMGVAMAYFNEDFMPITTDAYLYLSGTPFRAIATGEFIEDQVFNWTYSDEQRAKENWEGDENPYFSMPRMVLMTYQLPDAIREIAMKGEFDEFNLNVFFSAKGEGVLAEFVYEGEVQKWLDLIRGSFMETALDNLRMGAQKPPLPFSDTRLLSVLNHTFWFLPSVAACHAMYNLLAKRQNGFYHSYAVVVAAGASAGIGVDALPPVLGKMDEPLNSKSITLSCGKLTTGVSVKPWTGIFMLRNCSTPETYFQAAFRVQTPWTIKNPDGKSPNEEQVVKEECYVFDFAPNRALRQIADYSCRLNVDESNPEKKVEEFSRFLPVLAYDGSTMKQMDAAGILDIAMSGTSATLLARRWESALLVNVDNATLARLMDNEQAMQALMRIEGFRALSQDIQMIINKSESIKQAKGLASDRDLTKKEKKRLSDDEKEYKSKRKLIQEKLIKFATRVPIFMYLTDYREHSLTDVITKIEPDLFKKVTGLTVADFQLLVSLNVFNSSLMNDAVYKFKRYEDASLSYTGIDKHKGSDIGLYNTVVNSSDIMMSEDII